MELTLHERFLNHIRKIARMPPRMHLRFGTPYYVEDVTRQSRAVYEVEGDTIFVIRCFSSHKEYERWYKTFR